MIVRVSTQTEGLRVAEKKGKGMSLADGTRFVATVPYDRLVKTVNAVARRNTIDVGDMQWGSWSWWVAFLKSCHCYISENDVENSFDHLVSSGEAPCFMQTLPF